MFFIRTASGDDAERVRDLLVDSWRKTYIPLHGADLVEPVIARWHTLAAIKANIAAKNGEMLVADDGAELGGMAFAAMDDDGKTLYLKQLYVRSSCHRQGIGRDLFAEIETCFPTAQIMQIEVDKLNGGAIAFYAAHGLQVSGETGCCGGDSEISAFIMTKQLSHDHEHDHDHDHDHH